MMNSHYRCLLTVTLVVVAGTCHAEPSWKLFHSSKDKPSVNSGYTERFPIFVDDILKDQDVDSVKLNAEQKHQAAVWALTEKQEKRYVLLMTNKSGFYYKGLTPNEVLMENARTNEERNNFAEKVVRDEFERTAKDLASDTAYHMAAVKLAKENALPVLNKLDPTPYSPYSHKPVSLSSGDKLMLFVNEKDRTRAITSYLMQSIQKNKKIQLNIYVVGKNESAASISDWARRQSIPKGMVKRKLITLNKDDGKFLKLPSGTKTPALILVRGGESQIVNLSGF